MIKYNLSSKLNDIKNKSSYGTIFFEENRTQTAFNPGTGKIHMPASYSKFVERQEPLVMQLLKHEEAHAIWHDLPPVARTEAQLAFEIDFGYDRYMEMLENSKYRLHEKSYYFDDNGALEKSRVVNEFLAGVAAGVPQEPEYFSRMLENAPLLREFVKNAGFDNVHETLEKMRRGTYQYESIAK